MSPPDTCPTPPPLTRRLLLGALAAAGTAAVAAASPPGLDREVKAPQAGPQPHRGYQSTAHVRRYYELARY